MRGALVPIVLVAWLAGAASRADAREMDLYRVEMGGQIQDLRILDVDGDGRRDLVLLLLRGGTDEPERQELAVLRTPATPTPAVFWGPADVRRMDLQAAGPTASAGAVAVGRFGPEGQVRLRFLAPDGLHDLSPDGQPIPLEPRRAVATLLGRSPGRHLAFWDEHGDLDGDGVEECWFPAAQGSGRLQVLGGTPAADRTLDVPLFNRGASDAENLFLRYVSVPRLVPADLDGDGRQELLAWDDGALVAWSPTASGAPTLRLPLPFARADLGPDEIHTPRLQVQDVDGDGRADLLVTLVTGNRTQIGSFRTRLLHFAGPFFDPESGQLVEPRVRIDTESVVLHPRFVDLDGDGALDYVSDSIRGGKKDLLLRVLGQEPTIWHVAFRFQRARGTFEEVPYFSIERPYSREEAVSNHFGRSAFFEGDIDGDGHKDMLDLGNLNGLEILGAVPKQGSGPGDPVTFSGRLLPRQRTPEPLTAAAHVLDLDGDGLAEAVLTSQTTLFLIVPRGTP